LKKYSNQYLAGFFDGEGCVGVYKNSSGGYSSYRLETLITQSKSRNSKSLFRTLKKMFGGYITVINRSGCWRTMYIYRLCGLNAIKFLLTIRPYLIFKAAQADVTIQWYKRRTIRTKGKNKITFHQTANDEKISAKLKAMKRQQDD